MTPLMTPAQLLTGVIRPALRMLPEQLRSIDAQRILVASSLQECDLCSRWQVVDVDRPDVMGPARGLWQFEEGGGCRGVLEHAASRYWMRTICRQRGVQPTPSALWHALHLDDQLACVAARLLLFTDRRPLPGAGGEIAAWSIYEDVWNPGKAKPQKWPHCWREACTLLP